MKRRLHNLLYFLFYVISIGLIPACSSKSEKKGAIQLEVDWGKLNKKDGLWIVFYPFDDASHPFSKEMGDEMYIDFLPEGKYYGLVLNMSMDVKNIDFLDMYTFNKANVALKKSDNNQLLHAEMVYAGLVYLDVTKEKDRTMILVPQPLSMKVTFEIKKDAAVKKMTAKLKGVPIAINIMKATAQLSGDDEYLPLEVNSMMDRVSFHGFILMPIVANLTKASDGLSRTELEMNIFYENGAVEVICADVTDALKSVANENPTEVKFELIKIGASVTVSRWRTSTGQGDVNEYD